MKVAPLSWPPQHKHPEGACFYDIYRELQIGRPAS